MSGLMDLITKQAVLSLDISCSICFLL